MSTELKNSVKAQAHELGFVACGFAEAAPSQSISQLEKWLASGHEAGMGWMNRPDAIEKRADVRAYWPEAKTVVVFAFPYRTRPDEAPWDEAKMGRVARYARGLDYHDVLKHRLQSLLLWIQDKTPCEGRICVDSSPILEREWAVRAGLGWLGKNTLLMGREFGSYVLLCELLLDIEIAPDTPHIEQFCGSCTRCLDACPTDAFVAPGVLDANRCISYHTIENRNLAPKTLREQFGDWIFGCDVCQEVCPWNQKAARSDFFSNEPQLWKRDAMPSLEEWPQLSQEEFSRRMKGSPIKRAKKRGMKRNATRALKNRRSNS